MDRNDRLREILDAMTGATVAVMGDLVADLYLYGQTKRVSREAPVLILEHRSERLVLGGAANAIHNARTLGARVVPIGILGRDAAGESVRGALGALDINDEWVLDVDARATTTKQRIVGSGQNTTFQQILRIDRGDTRPVDRVTEMRLVEAVTEASRDCDVLIVSDYGYGVFTPAVVERVNHLAETGRVRVLIDSRYRLTHFRGAYAMTPNEPEAQEASGRVIRTDEDAEGVGRELMAATGAASIVVTRGRRGMALVRRDEPAVHIPIFGGDEIADVTGAGDTVIATIAAATAAGADLLEACVLANVAGGLVVMKAGTATVSAAEIREAIEREDPWPSS